MGQSVARPAVRLGALAGLCLLLGSRGGGAVVIKFSDLDGKCGPGTLTISGVEAECDPTGDNPCCNGGLCGGSKESCDCPACVRYVETPLGTRMIKGAVSLDCGSKARPPKNQKI
jgi:hypothetical protein